MLPPDQRHLLIDLLRPEPGYSLDEAIGTTFTLDLHSLMQVPVAFLHQAGLLRDDDGNVDPLTILESLRRFADKLTVFTQAGYIKLPSNLPRLAALLEPCVVEVGAKKERGLFHPKVWVLRFQRYEPSDQEPRVRYRVLCLSRNLTFDRSWDTTVALDGSLREEHVKVRGNAHLADFIEALPNLPLAKISRERRRRIKSIADELRRVEFESPDGFDDFAFHHGGIADGRDVLPDTRPKDRVMIVSPFLSDAIVKRYAESGSLTLVSRPDELDKLPRATLEHCERVFMLHRQAVSDDLDDRDETELDGLHAKLFVIDQGWNASVFSGSFNATNAAFERNVEFMIELKGKKSVCGVATIVPFEVSNDDRGKVRSLGDMLTPYDLNSRTEHSAEDDERWDDACHAARLAVASAGLVLQVTERDELFDLTLQSRKPVFEKLDCELHAWPLAVTSSYAQPLRREPVTFAELSFDAVTAWVAFELRQGSRRSVWVAKVELIGAPANREQRLLASLLDSREKLLRFLLLMLRLDEQDS